MGANPLQGITHSPILLLTHWVMPRGDFKMSIHLHVCLHEYLNKPIKIFGGLGKGFRLQLMLIYGI